MNGGYPARPSSPNAGWRVNSPPRKSRPLMDKKSRPLMDKNWLMKRARLRSSFEPPDRLAVGGNAMNGGDLRHRGERAIRQLFFIPALRFVSNLPWYPVMAMSTPLAWIKRGDGVSSNLPNQPRGPVCDYRSQAPPDRSFAR